MRRIAFDLVLVLGLVLLFYFRVYEFVPAALQVIALKALIVSIAIMHAHIVGKLLFGKVDWGGEFRIHHAARVVLYAFVLIAYSMGG